MDETRYAILPNGFVPKLGEGSVLRVEGYFGVVRCRKGGLVLVTGDDGEPLSPADCQRITDKEISKRTHNRRRERRRRARKRLDSESKAGESGD